MSRLYDVKIDEDRWNITEIDNSNYHSYKLVDKEKEEVYFLRYIIGLEQVSDEEFLIYKRYNRDLLEIRRCILQNSETITIFHKQFSHFHFISDDRILFTHTGRDTRSRCSDIYSIKDNAMVEEAEWIKGAIIDVYDDAILAELENNSYRVGTNKLIFTIDPDTLEPNSKCYSSLRDSFIDVETKEDVLNIKHEDSRYTDIITNYMFKQEQKTINNAKEKILKRDTI